jgi:GGDEF domain-containing protein
MRTKCKGFIVLFATGNAALNETASRLQSLLRDSDTAARLGGDEFALILFDSGTHATKVVAQKILNSLLSPFIIDGLLMNRFFILCQYCT